MEKEPLLQLLAQNEIGALFEALKGQFPGRLAELALLEGQWQELQAKVRAGVLTQEQISVREAQIRSSLKDFIAPDGSRARPGRKQAYWWFFGLIILVGIWGVCRLALKSDTGGNQSTSQTSGLQAIDSNPTTPEATVRQLTISGEIFRIRAEMEGSIAYQFLQAELAPYNQESMELRLRLRCIKPEYGKNISFLVIHLEHNSEEITPYRVDFPFVNPQSTGEGWVFFEVPKSWKQVSVLIYHGVPGSEKTVRIPLNL